VSLPTDRLAGFSALVQGHAIQRDEAKRLGRSIKQDFQVKVCDSRGIQHPPQLAFPGFHLDQGGRVVRIGNRYVVDREILSRFAEARAVIRRIAVAIDEHLGHDGLRLVWRRVRVH
jgi:hypothetical protein